MEDQATGFRRNESCVKAFTLTFFRWKIKNHLGEKAGERLRQLGTDGSHVKSRLWLGQNEHEDQHMVIYSSLHESNTQPHLLFVTTTSNWVDRRQITPFNGGWRGKLSKKFAVSHRKWITCLSEWVIGGIKEQTWKCSMTSYCDYREINIKVYYHRLDTHLNTRVTVIWWKWETKRSDLSHSPPKLAAKASPVCSTAKRCFIVWCFCIISYFISLLSPVEPT